MVISICREHVLTKISSPSLYIQTAVRLPASSPDILGEVFSTDNVTFTQTQMAEKSSKNLNCCVISLVGTLNRAGKTEPML